jgi:hypothetical protein
MLPSALRTLERTWLESRTFTVEASFKFCRFKPRRFKHFPQSTPGRSGRSGPWSPCNDSVVGPLLCWSSSSAVSLLQRLPHFAGFLLVVARSL